MARSEQQQNPEKHGPGSGEHRATPSHVPVPMVRALWYRQK